MFLTLWTRNIFAILLGVYNKLINYSNKFCWFFGRKWWDLIHSIHLVAEVWISAFSFYYYSGLQWSWHICHGIFHYWQFAAVKFSDDYWQFQGQYFVNDTVSGWCDCMCMCVCFLGRLEVCSWWCQNWCAYIVVTDAIIHHVKTSILNRLEYMMGHS